MPGIDQRRLHRSQGTGLVMSPYLCPWLGLIPQDVDSLMSSSLHESPRSNFAGVGGGVNKRAYKCNIYNFQLSPRCLCDGSFSMSSNPVVRSVILPTNRALHLLHKEPVLLCKVTSHPPLLVLSQPVFPTKPPWRLLQMALFLWDEFQNMVTTSSIRRQNADSRDSRLHNFSGLQSYHLLVTAGRKIWSILNFTATATGRGSLIQCGESNRLN